MNDYINREMAADSIVLECDNVTLEQARQAIKDVPSADVVEVVRCKDCMWGNNKTRSGKRYCELSDMYQVDDGFCNWGEKIK